MIFRGKKVLDGTLAEIQAQYGADTIRVRTDGGRAALDGMPGVDRVVDQGNLQEVRVDRAIRKRSCARWWRGPRCTSSRSRARRCTTSSCASRSRAPRPGHEPEQDPRRRRSRVPRHGAHQGVPHQHRGAADHDARPQLRAEADLRARRHLGEATSPSSIRRAATTIASPRPPESATTRSPSSPRTSCPSRRSSPSASTSPAVRSTRCASRSPIACARSSSSRSSRCRRSPIATGFATTPTTPRTKICSQLAEQDARRAAPPRALSGRAPRAGSSSTRCRVRSRRRRSACGRATPTAASTRRRSRTRCAPSSSRWRRCSCSSSSWSPRCRSS